MHNRSPRRKGGRQPRAISHFEDRRSTFKNADFTNLGRFFRRTRANFNELARKKSFYVSHHKKAQAWRVSFGERSRGIAGKLAASVQVEEVCFAANDVAVVEKLGFRGGFAAEPCRCWHQRGARAERDVAGVRRGSIEGHLVYFTTTLWSLRQQAQPFAVLEVEAECSAVLISRYVGLRGCKNRLRKIRRDPQRHLLFQ